ncbi:hypothetical protein FOA52_002048 [Chlamydomonas sp. UWO 241]|nr:hypothetical protein FOA52_002048 [Chlamydomonas sp. UWO 241]
MEAPPPATCMDDLPEELLLAVLTRVVSYGPRWANANLPLCAVLPYTQWDIDRNDDPLQGARASPFLPQVCSRWKAVLESAEARAITHRHVVLDIGHELLNGVFYPLRFQSQPLDKETFVRRLGVAKLRAPRLQRFVADNRLHITCLTINVEGLWHRHLDGDMAVLRNHTDFDETCIAFMLGQLAGTLQEFRLHNRFGRLPLRRARGLWVSLESCARLRTLHSVHPKPHLLFILDLKP